MGFFLGRRSIKANPAIRFCKIAGLFRSVSPDARRPNHKRTLDDQSSPGRWPSYRVPAKADGNNQDARTKVYSLCRPSLLSWTNRGCDRPDLFLSKPLRRSRSILSNRNQRLQFRTSPPEALRAPPGQVPHSIRMRLLGRTFTAEPVERSAEG